MIVILSRSVGVGGGKVGGNVKEEGFEYQGGGLVVVTDRKEEESEYQDGILVLVSHSESQYQGPRLGVVDGQGSRRFYSKVEGAVGVGARGCRVGVTAARNGILNPVWGPGPRHGESAVTVFQEVPQPRWQVVTHVPGTVTVGVELQLGLGPGIVVCSRRRHMACGPHLRRGHSVVMRAVAV